MTLFRSTLFNLFFFGCSFVMVLFGSVVQFVAPRLVLRVAIAWAGMLLWGARTICGISWRVVGKLPTGPALIASHHESAFDTLVWLTLVPRPAMIMKQELRRIPLFGRLTRLSGMIAVDRSAGVRAMRGLLREAADAVADGRQIIIFPEVGFHRTAGDPGGDRLGALLEQTGVPERAGGDPYCAATADPARYSAARITREVGRGVSG
jgi:1-acyl-sn-glycerol-3-phosphate acyltransferase